MQVKNNEIPNLNILIEITNLAAAGIPTKSLKFVNLARIKMDKTMADKLMYIPYDDTRNNTYLIEPTNDNLIKVPKVVKPTNKKTSL